MYNNHGNVSTEAFYSLNVRQFFYIKRGNTSVPNRDQTDPNSTPITPAPIRTIFLGTSFKLNAPVDDTILSSSTCKKLIRH